MKLSVSAIQPWVVCERKTLEIFAEVTPLLNGALKSELEANNHVRNVSLFVTKAWAVHIRALVYTYLGGSNKHTYVSLESRATN